jgi:CheY-like chemotaxis protein
MALKLLAGAPILIQDPSAVPPRILIVDDDAHVANAMHRLLRGHDVDVCGSGAEAIARCTTEDFDLVLCDVMMPGLSGMDVYKRLGELRPEMVPRIVFVTGGTFTPEISIFMDHVPNLVLDKPVLRAVLLDVVARMTMAAKPRV